MQLNTMVARRGDLPVLLSSILHLLHLDALRSGGGVDHPRKTFHTAFSFSFSPFLLFFRATTPRCALSFVDAPLSLGVLYDVQESRLRDGKKEVKQTNIQKGNACAAEQNEAPNDREIRLNSP